MTSPSSARLKYTIFGFCLFYRMAIRFQKFAAEEGYPGSPILMMVACEIWASIEGNTALDPAKLAPLLDAISPDTEDYRSRYTSAALDAVDAASKLLSFMETGASELIREVSELSTVAVDLHIQQSIPDAIPAEEVDHIIATHIDMQRERAFQEFAWKTSDRAAMSTDVTSAFAKAFLELQRYVIENDDF